MKPLVVALDYDGTIARDGVLDGEVARAIEHLRARGMLVVLVTGRQLLDLRQLLCDLTSFDAIVAENGAVALFPSVGRPTLLAPPVPSALLEELARRRLDARAGDCIVELDASAAGAVLDAVRDLELPLVLHFNRGRLMVLPQAVSKATGLREVLRTMRRSPHNAIAIGDAENDHELLRVAEVGAAVAWGSARLQAAADVVVPGAGPPAVATFLREIADAGRIDPPRSGRRRLVLGTDAAGQVVALAECGRNVLITGEPRSGKSWVTGLLCEQLVVHEYSTCIVDPEGDYLELEALPAVSVLGRDDPPPSMPELERVLRHADVSVVLDLTRLDQQQKHAYVLDAVRTLTDLRRRTGLPQRLVVDEAHYFLHDPGEAALLDRELAGHTLVTFQVSRLHPDVLAAAECVVVTRETDLAEVEVLHRAFARRCALPRWQQILGSLAIDEAVLLPVGETAGDDLRRFRIAPRLTRHVRHRHKYLDVPVPAGRAFRFCRDDGSVHRVAASLRELVDVLDTTPLARIEAHVHRGDLSRWIEDVVRDPALAASVRELERCHRSGAMLDFNSAVVHAIRTRYGVDDAPA
jgi:hypothetical protein